MRKITPPTTIITKNNNGTMNMLIGYYYDDSMRGRNILKLHHAIVPMLTPVRFAQLQDRQNFMDFSRCQYCCWLNDYIVITNDNTEFLKPTIQEFLWWKYWFKIFKSRGVDINAYNATKIIEI